MVSVLVSDPVGVPQIASTPEGLLCPARKTGNTSQCRIYTPAAGWAREKNMPENVKNHTLKDPTLNVGLNTMDSRLRGNDKTDCPGPLGLAKTVPYQGQFTGKTGIFVALRPILGIIRNEPRRVRMANQKLALSGAKWVKM